MDISQIKQKLSVIFNKVGVYISDEEYDEIIILDSLQFAIIIFEIEQAFNIYIGIDGDIVSYNELKTVNNYLCMIQKALSKQIKANP